MRPFVLISVLSVTLTTAFQVRPLLPRSLHRKSTCDGARLNVLESPHRGRSGTALNFFDKVFEEEGTLGKGITVGKVSVALISSDRGSSSIFGMLERAARDSGDSPRELAALTNEVCLSLLRKSDDWIGACSKSQWFGQKDAGKAESYCNDLSNGEAVKYEKEYIPGATSEEKPGGSTQVVVTIVLEIQGDSTTFDGAGFSITGTKEVLSSIASDALVDDGDCVNAAEVFWTPSERSEVLTRNDIILDFPELVDM